MARLARALEGRHPIPTAGDPELLALLPDSDDPTLIAVEHDRTLGAVWCPRHDPLLMRDDAGRALPEMVIAVCPEARGRGTGTARIDAFAQTMLARASALVFNVHLPNPAVRLYIRMGFSVAGVGRGRYGVAMSRPLQTGCRFDERRCSG